MNITGIRLIYFSPTKTTKKIVETVAGAINPDKIKHHDLTPCKVNIDEFEELNNELVIIGTPVYAGRVPLATAERLKKIKGNNCPAVLIAVYGNRHYEDALIELKDIASEAGFRPLAAAAFIGEHSFSTADHPIAGGRPDNEDMKSAAEFGKKIKNILQDKNLQYRDINVPGNHPYKSRANITGISPATIESKCTGCGTCSLNCPTGSIRINKIAETDKTTCIMCCACVKGCTNKARVNDSELVKTVIDMLIKKCSDRKEPEFYL